MIAEVGDMPKVSGSRIATPLAPPRPGSTPIRTPSRMPITISIRLNGWITTEKPWNRLAISSILRVFPRPDAKAARRRGYSPKKSSIGPFGNGTRNHFSNIR